MFILLDSRKGKTEGRVVLMSVVQLNMEGTWMRMTVTISDYLKPTLYNCSRLVLLLNTLNGCHFLPPAL